MRVEVLADSVNPGGDRLTTFQLRFPRIILPQVRTYGMLSYSVRSSRAVPTEALIREVEADPFVPKEWRERRKGMVAGEPLAAEATGAAHAVWAQAREEATYRARQLLGLKVAKEHVNRLLEPFAWTDMVLTGTGNELAHLLRQRTRDDAQPEFQELATLMRGALANSTPAELAVGDWHLPYVPDDEHGYHVEYAEGDPADVPFISAGRCRRVSYKPFGDETPDRDKDAERGRECQKDGHWSPLEHPAMACAVSRHYAKLRGWMSLRHQLGH